MNCAVHSEKKLSVICLAPHYCQQRKLCYECLNNHEMTQAVPIDLLFSYIEKKLVKENIQKTSEYTQLFDNFNSQLFQYESMINKIFLDMRNKIKQIHDLIKEQDQDYINFTNQNKNISTLSDSNLNTLVYILEGRSQETMTAKKKFYEQLKHLQNQTDSTMNNCHLSITELTQKVSFIKDSLQKLNSKFKINQPIISYDDCKKNGVQREIKKVDGSIGRLIQEEGYYLNNQRIGQWNYNISGNIMYNLAWQFSNGGKYDWLGKIGEWIELKDEFSNNKQVALVGHYKNSKKEGRWDHLWRENFNQDFCIINGGKFKEGIKFDQWIELKDEFSYNKQVALTGQYENGKKVGRWDHIYFWKETDVGQQEINGCKIKIGKWIELMGDKPNVSYNNNYGKNYSSWERLWRENEDKKFLQIEGGDFNRSSSKIKFGKWVELWDQFSKDALVTFEGEYNIKGMKVGKWEFKYENKTIGGGSFGEEQIKEGIWEELDKVFTRDGQVTYHGSYNSKGMKIGRWEIKYGNETIGGGSYGQEQIKEGIWQELDEEFDQRRKVTYTGQYKEGMKQGSWDTKYEGKIIGGGSYGKNGIKNGQWIEIDGDFGMWTQQLFIGLYDNNGQKIGKWQKKVDKQIIA
ncbi:unnamed protein product [Paramecium sonneborni]|uniref:Uncharacterized protein n=1 Tax=Paramecium sonneborni TaxID=65129 RepID=A0A8S1RKU3_9CILI|nr:unnamed protein product [Paramecium sonneborni]